MSILKDNDLKPYRARKIAIILNPVSGRGRGAKLRQEVETQMRVGCSTLANPPTWEILQTTSQGTGTTLAAEAVAQGADLVVAAGGDGTLAEVLNGIVNTSAKFGLLPLGTGNDFSRCLGVGTDITFAVTTLLHGIAHPIDIGKTQGRYFLNVAGCGFDAIVAEKVNNGVRFLHGAPAYIAGILLSLPKMRPVTMRLTLDGKTEETRAILCAIANTRSYGGGMLIAPDARIDDGLFDVCVIGDTSRTEFLQTFPKVFTGEHIQHPKVRIMQAKRVQIECETPLPVLVDGEVVGTTPVTFEMFPSAIECMTPHPYA